MTASYLSPPTTCSNKDTGTISEASSYTYSDNSSFGGALKIISVNERKTLGKETSLSIKVLRNSFRTRSCAVCSVTSVVSDSVTPWTVAHQAPLSMGFSRQEHWSGLLFPSPGESSRLGD